MLKFCLTAFLLLIICQVINAQGFKEILPMHSTCNDVERILGGEHCGNNEETFTIKKERIRIVFSTKECEEFYGKKWNIPIGTVVFIGRNFQKPVTMEELGIKMVEAEYVKNYTDILGQIIYDKKNGGLSFSTINGYVKRISYYPSKMDESNLLCEKSKGENLKENFNCGREQ